MGSAPQGLTPPKPPKKPPKPAPLVEPADPGALEKLVAAAKGYRPLYHHLEAQIRRAIPGAVIAARDRYVAIGAPLEFGIANHEAVIQLLGERIRLQSLFTPLRGFEPRFALPTSVDHGVHAQ